MTKIAIIIGSVRHGERVSQPIAEWVAKSIGDRAEAEIVDLRDYPMPLFEENMPPRYNQSRQPADDAKKWLVKIADFDGFVVVTPEYNRSTSAAIKNAIDHTDYQMEKKPVALVGHGSSGGAQAVATLRITFPGIGAFTIPTAVFLDNSLAENITNGELAEELAAQPYGPQAQLNSQLDELVWFCDNLKQAAR